MRYLQRIDTPDIQPDAEFILDGLNMPEKMLIASGQNADHAEVGRFEERDEVPSNVAPLCLDIIGNDDVIDPNVPHIRLMFRLARSVTIAQSYV